MTHPDAARRYHSSALTYLAVWLRLGEMQKAVESGAPSGGIVNSFQNDASAPVEDLPLYHLPGVRSYRDITLLDPDDFLERAFAGLAELLGYPPRPDQWQHNDRFELSDTITREGDLARLPYVHREADPDDPDSERVGELVVKKLDGSWRLWFDDTLFAPITLFLRE